MRINKPTNVYLVLMEKDFDLWNQYKKQVNKIEKRIEFQERDVRWCILGINIGYEEDGKGERLSRPVVIVRKFSKSACLIIPLSTTKKKSGYNYPLGVIGKEYSSAIISQLRFIDSRRLGSLVGTLDTKVFNDLKKSVTGICLSI
jgi:mRNA interferase MazF